MFSRPMPLLGPVVGAVVGWGINNPPECPGYILREPIVPVTCKRFAFCRDELAGVDVFVIINSVREELPWGGETSPSGCGRMKGNGCPRRGSTGSEVGAVSLSPS